MRLSGNILGVNFIVEFDICVSGFKTADGLELLD